MKRKKRGQFYIIGALIIISLIAGITTLINFTILKPEPIKFYDLSDNFDEETTKVVDFGVVNATVAIKEKVEEFSKNFTQYSQEKDPNMGLILVYGNKNNVTIKNFASEPVLTGNETCKNCINNCTIITNDRTECENACIYGTTPVGDWTNIFGKPCSLTAGALEPVISKVSFQLGEEKLTRNIKEKMENYVDTSTAVSGDLISLKIAGAVHNFNLTESSSYFYVFATTNEKERYVLTK